MHSSDFVNHLNDYRPDWNHLNINCTNIISFFFQLSSYSTGARRSEDDHQDKPRFPGALNSRYTEKLEFDDPEDGQAIPVYRVMDRNGKVLDGALDPKVFISLFLFSQI